MKKYVEDYAFNVFGEALSNAQIEKICAVRAQWLAIVEGGEASQDKFNLVVKMPLEAEEISVAPVEKLYFCRHEDNMREIYKNETHAKEWDEKSPLHFVDEVEYDEGHNIVKFNGMSVKDFVESLDDDPAEIERLTDWIYSDYAYPSALSD